MGNCGGKDLCGSQNKSDMVKISKELRGESQFLPSEKLSAMGMPDHICKNGGGISSCRNKPELFWVLDYSGNAMLAQETQNESFYEFERVFTRKYSELGHSPNNRIIASPMGEKFLITSYTNLCFLVCSNSGGEVLFKHECDWANESRLGVPPNIQRKASCETSSMVLLFLTSAIWLSDSTVVMSFSNGTVELVELESDRNVRWEPMKKIKNFESVSITCLASDQNDFSFFICGGEKSFVCKVEGEKQKTIWVSILPQSSIDAISISKGSVAVAPAKGDILILSYEKGLKLMSLNYGGVGGVCSIFWTPKNNNLIVQSIREIVMLKVDQRITSENFYPPIITKMNDNELGFFMHSAQCIWSSDHLIVGNFSGSIFLVQIK